MATWRSPGDEVGEAVAELVDAFHGTIEAFAAIDAPVIAAVQGVAAGGGMSLLLLLDLAIAAESASFTMAYTAAGLTPDGGGSWTLPRIVGERVAADLILTNRRLSAAEALQLGIVSRVVPDSDLEAAVSEIAAGFASGPTPGAGSEQAAPGDGLGNRGAAGLGG